MNYILLSIGLIPDYIKFTINTILSVDKGAKVYLCTDTKVDYKQENLTVLDLKDVHSDKAEHFKDLQIYKNTIFESNPLWETSTLRIFYMESIKKYLNLDEFVHFDNDVLIYKPFEDIKGVVDRKSFNITKGSDKNFVFGYSYISDNSILSFLTDKIIEISHFGKMHDWKFNYFKPYNEMNFLGEIYKENINNFNPLPTLPYGNDYVFDPAGYGQYLDGTHLHPKKFYSPKYMNLNDYIGREINSKRIIIKFKNREPIVKWNNKTLSLVNLHVHSKRMDKFTPSAYESYI